MQKESQSLRTLYVYISQSVFVYSIFFVILHSERENLDSNIKEAL